MSDATKDSYRIIDRTTNQEFNLPYLTIGQVLKSDSNRFYNTRTKKTETKKGLIKFMQKQNLIEKVDYLTSLVIMPQSGTRWDQTTGKFRPHDSSCEFGKDSCTCWCNDQYHGIKVVI